MNKLTQVRQALQNNRGIVIVGAPEQNYLPNGTSWRHTVDFYVAPRKGIYNPRELQVFMMMLLGGLKPTQQDNFDEWGKKLRFGKLYFDEDIGTESIRRELVLTDADVLSSAGFVDGKLIIERVEKLRRRIWVRLYPDVQIAVAALKEGKNQYEILTTELPQPLGILARFAKVFVE